MGFCILYIICHNATAALDIANYALFKKMSHYVYNLFCFVCFQLGNVCKR